MTAAIGTAKNAAMAETKGKESATLADFAAGLRYEDIPQAVIDRTVDFFVDWAGSALSGRGQRAIAALENFAEADGTCRRTLGNPGVPEHDIAAVCGLDQCRRLAHFGTGRRA